ncbi:unnamed protein product [Blepharisma stoltei]|uniref:Beta-catenin-interacting ICAT domain-containing protein n=1 Tax=Blepharisma stoltei TaxID=1481888 RepID=A0AAU9JAD0_9CILI|nr:unnamed protein product [Blepharisma stoltei]
MASRGEAETQALRQRVEEQLSRLITQLRDLEENKELMDDSEYSSMKEDTLQQLREFEAQLERWKSGNITLIDDFNRIQIAIQQAVSQAFKTPEVIQMFAARQPQQLRSRLEEMERDRHLGKIQEQDYQAKRLEILMALDKLGETLSPEERELLVSFSSAGNRVEANQDREVDAKGLFPAAKGLLSHAKHLIKDDKLQL